MADEDVGHEYRIDVVPSAVGFWTRLGFAEVEAKGEQAYLMTKGGDRPMSKRVSSTRSVPRKRSE